MANDDARTIEHEIVELLAAARKEGIYTEDPGWIPIDEKLVALGYEVGGWT